MQWRWGVGATWIFKRVVTGCSRLGTGVRCGLVTGYRRGFMNWIGVGFEVRESIGLEAAFKRGWEWGQIEGGRGRRGVAHRLRTRAASVDSRTGSTHFLSRWCCVGLPSLAFVGGWKKRGEAIIYQRGSFIRTTLFSQFEAPSGGGLEWRCTVKGVRIVWRENIWKWMIEWG